MNLPMIYHSKGFDLEITDFEYRHDPTPSAGIIHLKPQGIFYVDIILICETERVKKKAKLEELSNNISER